MGFPLLLAGLALNAWARLDAGAHRRLCGGCGLTVLQLFQALDEARAPGRRLRAGSRSHRFIDLLQALWRGIAQKGGDVLGQVVGTARRLAG